MSEETTQAEVQEDTTLEEINEVASEETAEAEEGSEEKKEKKKVKRSRPVTLEMLVKKFKSPIQGRQRKVQDWEDRTAKRLKDLGFRNVPIANRTAEFCTFELTLGTIRAVIRSEHSVWSSRGLVKFTDSAPPAPVAEVTVETVVEPTAEPTQEAA